VDNVFGSTPYPVAVANMAKKGLQEPPADKNMNQSLVATGIGGPQVGSTRGPQSTGAVAES